MTPATTRTPNVFTIGGGRVAAALSGALRRAGVPVLGLWARRPDRARAAGAIAGVAAFSAGPPDLLLEADTVLVAVSDDAVGQVAAMLVETGLLTKKHVLLKCSGARPARETFGPVAERVGGVGTLHPLRSIADPRHAIGTMKGTLFGVEGDRLGVAAARELVAWLGGTALDLSGSDMALYHAAATVASNYLVTLADAAARILMGIGIGRDEALRALLPLMAETQANLEAQGPEAALTGPIARGDAATVERHLAALAERVPDLVELYRVAGRLTVALARKKGEAAADSLARIEQALADGK